MLGFQLRSSTNVPSCYCYALRVLCVALKKGGARKNIYQNKKEIEQAMPYAVACSKANLPFDLKTQGWILI